MRIKKVINLESKSDSVEQYWRWNNIEIPGIPNSISDNNLESTIVSVLSINVYVAADDIEACCRIGKSKENSLKHEKLIKKILFALLIGNITNVS